MKRITLQAIAQVVPNKAGIEAPSRLEVSKSISQEEFNLDYADNVTVGKVSFEKDGISNSQDTAVYMGWNKIKCRFIVK